jgi:hypothetical protein
MVSKVPNDFDHTKGPNWVIDLATVYNATETLIYDLAFDCAAVNSSLIADDCPWAVEYDIGWQTNQVKNIISSSSPHSNFSKDNTLFAYFIGINDASIPVVNSRTGLEDILKRSNEELFQYHDDVYELGFRKFLFISVPRK